MNEIGLVGCAGPIVAHEEYGVGKVVAVVEKMGSLWHAGEIQHEKTLTMSAKIHKSYNAIGYFDGRLSKKARMKLHHSKLIIPYLNWSGKLTSPPLSKCTSQRNIALSGIHPCLTFISNLRRNQQSSAS